MPYGYKTSERAKQRAGEGLAVCPGGLPQPDGRVVAHDAEGGERKQN